MVTYLGTRNIAIFSCDLDSFDFKASKPQTVIDNVMKKVEKLGKGIILLHDFQKHTAEALPELLHRLKAGGFKVVKMIAKAPVQTIAAIRRRDFEGHETANREFAASLQCSADDFGIGSLAQDMSGACASMAMSSCRRTACWQTPLALCQTN